MNIFLKKLLHYNFRYGLILELSLQDWIKNDNKKIKKSQKSIEINT